MNKSAKLLFMASGLWSVSVGIMIILKVTGDSNISNLYLGLGLIGAACCLIAGIQINKEGKGK